MTSKKAALPSRDAMLATIRRLLRPTSFEEEDTSDSDQLSFTSREGGDVGEGTPDPALVRLARALTKELEAAVPGVRAWVDGVDEWVEIGVKLPTGEVPAKKAAPARPARGKIQEPPVQAPAPQTTSSRSRAYLRPGDEITYTNFTIGGSQEGSAIVTWDHGKIVEARTLGGEKIRLERAGDGSLRRFT